MVCVNNNGEREFCAGWLTQLFPRYSSWQWLLRRAGWLAGRCVLAGRSLASSKGRQIKTLTTRNAGGCRQILVVEVFATRQEDYHCRRLTLGGREGVGGGSDER